MEQYASNYEHQEQPGKNVLGIVGFALSFCTGPIGLILSLIALKDRPKGFAIAGVIIGIISTIVMAVGGYLLYAGYNKFVKPAMEEVADYRTITSVVEAHRQSTGSLPTDLQSISGSFPAGVPQDPWGNPYTIEPDQHAAGWSLVSAGPDGQVGTPDDWKFPSGLSDEAVFNELQFMIMNHMGLDRAGLDQARQRP